MRVNTNNNSISQLTTSHSIHTHTTHCDMVHQSNRNHFLFLVFPAQGHINPALNLAKRLIICTGAQVTFVTSMSAHRRLVKNSSLFPDGGLTFEPLFNNDDSGFKSAEDVDQCLSEMRRGCEAISGIIEKLAGEGRPVSCILYTVLFPWTIQVADKFHLFSALLCVQPATVFDIYYYYFNGYRDLIVDKIDDPEYGVQLPGLPLLRSRDLPSSLLPSNAHPALYDYYLQQYHILSHGTKSFRTIIVNTFDELESESLQAVEKFNLMGVGPLIPTAFLTDEHPTKDSSGGDLFDHSKEYLKWLDSQDKSSVAYVSFGSLAVLSDKQMEALAHGLVDSGRPFLWVIRDCKDGKYAEMLGQEHKGMVVPWCSQVEVLNHDSVGCFVTHCGWNSTLETVAMGVPVVTFPQWNDQGTNAKLIVDVWKMGVRVTPDQEDKIVGSEEIVRCLERVMESEEFRNNARKWKDSARQAVKEDGSSTRNLIRFIEEIEQFYY